MNYSEILNYIYQTPALIAILVAIFEFFIPYPFFIRLNKLIPIFAELGRRVNKLNYSPKYQIFAGTFFSFLVLFTILVLFWGLKELTAFNKILDIVILLLIVESRPHRVAFKTILKLVNTNQNEQAKKILAKYTLRTTNKLSAMGLIKAASEMYVLRQFYNFYVPIVLYIIFNGNVLIPLIYGFSVILAMAFNRKLPINESFGKAISFIASLFELYTLPLLLLIGAIIPHSKANIFENIKIVFNTYPSKIGGMFLAEMASICHIKLGGPRYYMINLFRFPTIGGTVDPNMDNAQKLALRATLTIWITIIANVALMILLKHTFYF